MRPSIDALVSLLQERAPRPLTIQQMAEALELHSYDWKQMRTALDAHVAHRTLRRIGKTRYQWVRDLERQEHGRRLSAGRGIHRGRTPTVVEGRYSRVRAGYGFVEVVGRAASQFARDIMIPDGMEGEALHGDQVRVEMIRRDLRRQRATGQVASVTHRAHDKIIGMLELRRNRWLLVPQNDRLPPVEIVGPSVPHREQAGLVALVRLVRMPTAVRGPGGELDDVLGTADDPHVQFLCIAHEHGLRIDFPSEVMSDAENLPQDPCDQDRSGRQDLRTLPFVTIDGETARDFDDAVCLQMEKGGSCQLRVAIADVSHYVQPGSTLDQEAAKRGTSVYFPDRAIPMFPPQLSQQLCSLNPDHDRLVLVVELRYDRAGQRRDARFYRAIMRSHARLTYTTVAAVLSTTDTPQLRALRHELGTLLSPLRSMRELMLKLYRNRVAAGSLDLDLPEALIDLSNEGRSVGVRALERNDAHRMIEEFMLEANRAVASYLRDHQIPFPYRIHESPPSADLHELNQLLLPFGLAVRCDDRVRSKDVQRLLDELQGDRLARALTRYVLRALTQAQYSTTNAGHFGLAFPIYCHFTSPIRRYPDLLVHRQLCRLLDGQTEPARVEGDAIEVASVQSSLAERQAMEAERAMLDLKKAEFMLDHLLEPEAGTIVAVTSIGLFVELDAYPIEGLLRADELPDDRYYFVEEERSVRGARGSQRFRIGDRLLVEAFNVSVSRRQIDFALLKRLPSSREGVAAMKAARVGKRTPRRGTKKQRSPHGPQKKRRK